MILVTGFEPFGGDTENASGTVVQTLRDRPGLVTAILPVEFGTAGDLLVDLCQEARPDVVVCVGEAGGRAALTVERFAYNVIDARIPDNAGWQPHSVTIDPGLDDVLETEIDVEALVAAVSVTGVPAAVSQDPGRFVCNEVYFRALADVQVPAVFVHLPAVRAEGTATVGAETDTVSVTGALPSSAELVSALEAIVATLLRTGERAPRG